MRWSRIAVLGLLAVTACGRLGFDDTPNPDPDAMTSEVTVSERAGASRSGVIDTTLKDYEPTSNFRAAEFLGAWSDSGNTPTLPGLLRFDLSSLAGATVVGARLELALHTGLNTTFTAAPIEAREITEPWEESVVNYVERTSAAVWSGQGASGASRGVTVGAAEGGNGDRLSIELDTTVVQGWVDSPDANHGVALLETGGAGLGVWVCSSEFADESRRPQLTLEIAP